MSFTSTSLQLLFPAFYSNIFPSQIIYKDDVFSEEILTFAVEAGHLVELLSADIAELALDGLLLRPAVGNRLLNRIHFTQSLARNNSAATKQPCFQATTVLALALLYVFIRDGYTFRHRHLPQFSIFSGPRGSIT